MYRIVKVILSICFTIAWLYSNSRQQPVLSVQNFEYIWQKDVTSGSGKGQLIPSGDEAKHSIEKSFSRAIQQRWNVEVPEMILSVKPLPLFSLSNSPKFNTKLKDKQSGTWYLFLQIFDTGNPFIYYNEDDSIATTLELKCRLVSFNDSVILARTLLVKMNKEKAPPDQVVLKRLPAYPSYFVNAFDSIATWMFQQDNVNEKDLWLKPACVFSETKFEQEPLTQLEFKSENDSIDHLTEPQFSFHTPGPTYTKTKSKKNIGGNMATGIITTFTGFGSDKVRLYEYNADFPFEMKDSTVYHCVMHYAERETAERERTKGDNADASDNSYSVNGKSYSIKTGSYRIMERRIDSSFINVITLGNDTLATYRISYVKAEEYKSYTHLWDGSDSSTIITLPQEWNNIKEDDNVIIYGKTGDNSFLMKTTNENTASEFYIDEKLAMIMYGGSKPAEAKIFQPVSEQLLKIFTILSSLSYAYFNYTAN